MAKVTGIGGVFLRSANRDGVATWYRDVLGVEFDENHMVVFDDNSGPYSVVSLFPDDSDYIGEPTQQDVMINFRVDDLAALSAHARSLGVEFEEINHDTYGDFSWVIDPEGRRVELWQPPAEDD